MPQLLSSTIKRKLYRQTFEIKSNNQSVYRHTLLINPEDMNIEEPNRATVTQTLGGAYIAMFGQGLHNVSISGKTGYNARKNADGTLTDGYEEIKNLRRKIYRDFINDKTGSYEMFWYDWENEEYYKIIPLSMRIQRNAGMGNMYRYDIQFVCIQPASATGMVTSAWWNNLLAIIEAYNAGQKTATIASALSEILNLFKKGGK